MNPRGVLVDTSAWIELLQDRRSCEAELLEELIEDSQPIHLTGLVFAELLRGCLVDSDVHRLRESLLAYPSVEPKYPSTYDHAATLYRKARTRGVEVRGTVDCVIAALALENDLAVLHKDRDYEKIATVSDLVTMSSVTSPLAPAHRRPPGWH